MGSPLTCMGGRNGVGMASLLVSGDENPGSLPSPLWYLPAGDVGELHYGLLRVEV